MQRYELTKYELNKEIIYKKLSITYIVYKLVLGFI